MRTRQNDKDDMKDAYEHDAQAQPSSSESEHEALDARKFDSFAGSTAADAVMELEAAVAEPAALVQPTPALAAIMRAATKALHDFTQQQGSHRASQLDLDAHPIALHVDGFDAEQIWGQLDTTGVALLRRARKLMARSEEAETLLLPAAAARLNGLSSGISGSRSKRKRDTKSGGSDRLAIKDGEDLSEGDSDGDEAAPEDGSSGSSDDNVGLRYGGGNSAEDSEDQDPSDLSEGGEIGAPVLPAGKDPAGKRRKPSSPGSSKKAGRKRPKLDVEDDFMRMDDMEAFVQQAERRAAAGSDEESASESSEDDDDGGDGRFPDSGVESGSDEEMAALLESSSALVGRAPPIGRLHRKGAAAAAAEEDDSDGSGGSGSGGDMYDSFFDPKPIGGRNRRGEEYEEQRSWHDSDTEGDAEVAADDKEWDGDALFDTGEGRTGGAEGEDGDSDGDEGGEGATGLSKHERRTAAMKARIAVMEQAAIGDKDWFMKGEAQAGHRPLNSALELDLDFERTLQPPPAPTEDSSRALEDLIKGRIAERNFDDVIRVAPPETAVAKTALELDDKKNAKGLGELYEEEYLKARAPTNIVEERDADAKTEARALLKALFVKLDALSHFHYAPKPVVEEMAVVSEVPALAMEEVAPQVASTVDMRYAGEVFSGAKALPAGETELSREDRKRSRAGKKRASRNRRSQKEAKKKQQSIATGGEAPIQGRRSESAAAAAATAAKKDGKRGGRKTASATGTASHSKGSDYTKSTKVFAKLADEQAAAKAGSVRSGRVTASNGLSAASFKL